MMSAGSSRKARPLRREKRQFEKHSRMWYTDINSPGYRGELSQKKQVKPCGYWSLTPRGAESEGSW